MGLFHHLERNNIQTRVLFSGNVTRHPAYRHHFAEYPEADRVMRRGGLIGCHHGMTNEDVDRVCDCIIDYFGSGGK
jgi:CDP-6-deoxy-D-xylo-4-hexulose-3-dehydrase